MRLLAGLAATVLLTAACGGAAVAPSPTATVAPTPTPSPTPQTKFVFNADLKSSNEVPAIADAEASCSGKGVFTLNTTKDSLGKITAATAQFDLTITGCPTTTEIILFHIHKQVAGQNGSVIIDSGQKATEPIALTTGSTSSARQMDVARATGSPWLTMRIGSSRYVSRACSQLARVRSPLGSGSTTSSGTSCATRYARIASTSNIPFPPLMTSRFVLPCSSSSMATSSRDWSAGLGRPSA